MKTCNEEKKEALAFREKKQKATFRVGDKVTTNFILEGHYYPGIVESISNDGTMINVKYDGDGSTESLSSENVRMRIPPTATQTALGGPLTDEEAGFGGGSDDTITIESYKLRSDLAKLIEITEDTAAASKLYEEAAHEAMQAHKMKLATELSLRASELPED